MAFAPFTDDRGSDSPVLNLSKPNYSAESLSEGKLQDDDIVSEEDFDSETRALRRSTRSSDVKQDDKANNNKSPAEKTPSSAIFPGLLAGDLPKDANQLSNVYGLIGNIQALLKAAVENSSKDKGEKKLEPFWGELGSYKSVFSFD